MDYWAALNKTQQVGILLIPSLATLQPSSFLRRLPWQGWVLSLSVQTLLSEDLENEIPSTRKLGGEEFLGPVGPNCW